MPGEAGDDPLASGFGHVVLVTPIEMSFEGVFRCGVAGPPAVGGARHRQHGVCAVGQVLEEVAPTPAVGTSLRVPVCLVEDDKIVSAELGRPEEALCGPELDVSPLKFDRPVIILANRRRTVFRDVQVLVKFGPPLVEQEVRSGDDQDTRLLRNWRDVRRSLE
nr:hypothetical protein [Halomicrobium urmianum]